MEWVSFYTSIVFNGFLYSQIFCIAFVFVCCFFLYSLFLLYINNAIDDVVEMSYGT